MEIFKNLPREILSVIFVFASQMRIVEYTERLKEELNRMDTKIFSWEYENLNDKIIRINLHYFKIPQLVSGYLCSYDMWDNLHRELSFMGSYMIPNHDDIPYYIYDKITDRVGTFSIDASMLGNSIISIVISSFSRYGNDEDDDKLIINDIYNPFECEFILNLIQKCDTKIVLNIFTPTKFTQDEHEYLRYLLRNRNRVKY